MKLASAIEGGLAGATTISLLGETLRKIDGRPAGSNSFNGKKIKKRFKKAGSKKPLKATKQYVQLAGDVLGGTAFLGLSSLGKRKHAMLRGAILGAAAGLGAVFFSNYHEEDDNKANGHEGFPSTRLAEDTLLKKAMQVGLFTLGGLVAGRIVQGPAKKKKQQKKKK